ncbi:MAG: hypothetical protein NTZ84_00620 [Candidatus Nealsonbacteria bacterium]|nr:hypothetical protein [Candidatus Nealsonbacteria bacterium]
MIKNNKKALILIILFFVFSFFSFDKAKAGKNDNVSGWAWSENIGWVSFNCSDPGTCGTVDYGVNIDLNLGNGLLSGYAWSENIGWITFNDSQLGGCPAGPCEARFSSATNELSGWARACSVFSNGCSGALNLNRGSWDGWIRFKGNNYGVALDSISREFKNWAWGGHDAGPSTAVIGWLSFNSKNCDTNGDGKSEGGTGCPAAGQPIADYKIVLSSPKPSASNLTVGGPNPIDYCPSSIHPPVRLSWTFVAANPSDNQSAYEIQISTNSGFSSTVESEHATNTGGSYVAKNLAYGSVTYYWRLKVWDDTIQQVESDWITGPSFTTIAYPYPTPNFDWLPLKIIVGKPVTFTDLTDFHVDPGAKSWIWDIDNNGTNDYSGLVITHTYNLPSPGGYTIKLETTVGGKTCSITKKTSSVFFSSPTWRETPPPR